MHTSLATHPSCRHMIISSTKHKLTVFELGRCFSHLSRNGFASSGVLRACLEDFIHSKMRMLLHVLRGGVENINTGISFKRLTMDPIVSSFASGYVTTWLLSSFQPCMLR